MNAKTIIKSEQQRIAMQGNRLGNYKSMLAYEIEKQSKLEERVFLHKYEHHFSRRLLVVLCLQILQSSSILSPYIEAYRSLPKPTCHYQVLPTQQSMLGLDTTSR